MVIRNVNFKFFSKILKLENNKINNLFGIEYEIRNTGISIIIF